MINFFLKKCKEFGLRLSYLYGTRESSTVKREFFKLKPKIKIMLKLNHKKLDVWQQSVEFIGLIYELTNKFPSDERFGLTSQLRRASVSVSSNIAEGSARKSNKERARFYEMARSSLVEIDTQLIIAIKLNFVEYKSIKSTESLLERLFAMSTNLIKQT